jgi:hypothetical protein
MSWETRPNGLRHYTRTWRVKGKVVRIYIGGGAPGNQAAITDFCRRKLIDCERQRRALRANEIRRFETDLLLLDALTHLIARDALEAAGFRQHARGQWRKRREPKKTFGSDAAAGGHRDEPAAFDQASGQGRQVGPQITPPTAGSPGLLQSVPRPRKPRLRSSGPQVRGRRLDHPRTRRAYRRALIVGWPTRTRSLAATGGPRPSAVSFGAAPADRGPSALATGRKGQYKRLTTRRSTAVVLRRLTSQRLCRAPPNRAFRARVCSARQFAPLRGGVAHPTAAKCALTQRTFKR